MKTTKIKQPSTKGRTIIRYVESALWARAKEIAGDDTRRIQVLSTTEVIVWNYPGHYMKVVTKGGNR